MSKKRQTYHRFTDELLKRLQPARGGAVLSFDDVCSGVKTLLEMKSAERLAVATELMTLASYFWREKAEATGDQLALLVVEVIGAEAAERVMSSVGIGRAQAQKIVETHKRGPATAAGMAPPSLTGFKLRR